LHLDKRALYYVCGCYTIFRTAGGAVFEKWGTVDAGSEGSRVCPYKLVLCPSLLLSMPEGAYLKWTNHLDSQSSDNQTP